MRVPLKSHPAIHGMETLGVVLALDGNNKHAFQELLKKANKWSANIRVGHLKPSIVV